MITPNAEKKSYQQQVNDLLDRIRPLQRSLDRLDNKASRGYTKGARPPAISSELARGDQKRAIRLQEEIDNLNHQRVEIENEWRKETEALDALKTAP